MSVKGHNLVITTPPVLAQRLLCSTPPAKTNSSGKERPRVGEERRGGVGRGRWGGEVGWWWRGAVVVVTSLPLSGRCSLRPSGAPVTNTPAPPHTHTHTQHPATPHTHNPLPPPASLRQTKYLWVWCGGRKVSSTTYQRRP